MSRRTVSVKTNRPSSSSSRRSVSIIKNNTPENDQNQPPVYCVVNSTPLIISSEKQPRLTRLTENPVYLFHASGSQSPRSPSEGQQSNIYSPIPNSSGNVQRPNVQYPLGHLNIANISSARMDTDSRSNHSQADARSHFTQDDTQSEKDFNIVQGAGDLVDEDTKVERPRKRRSIRPWRGYVVEEEEKERYFQSMGVNDYYSNESISDGDTAISISSATEKLRHLHIKFAAHRKFIDDGRSLDSREVVDPAIPFNVPAPKPGECECDTNQKKFGVHHHKFPKEAIPRCDQYSNNANMLYHYRLIITPEINFVTRDPTTIYYDGKDFWFEGYSVFTHVLIDDIPAYAFTRNLIDYTVRFVKVDYIPQGFCIKDLDIVSDYFFNDIMELTDWKRDSDEKNCCRRFHFMPRFVHRTQDLTMETNREISEILSMGEVIQYLIEACSPFTEKDVIKNYNIEDWKEFAKEKHGTLVTNLRNKPRSIRVDDVTSYGMSEGKKYPDIVHVTPKSKDGSKIDMKEYGNLCAKLTKAKRAVKSRAIPRREDQKLVWSLAEEIQKRKELRGTTKWVDISFTSRKYVNTGLRWDVCQHASYLPALTNYLRFMLCTSVFERNMNYKFKDKSLLKVALTHPSHMDTASYSAFIWNMLQNLGKQYPHVEKRKPNKVPLIGAKKKGVIYMTNLMANLNQEDETRSMCRHNERLEFLGDAILDYLSSLHLFLMFPEKGPGKLTAFRSGIVQTENLADLSKKIGLDQFILVQHRVAELNKSESYLGNALEAVVGAVFLDGGLTAVDNLLSFLLFIDDVHLCKVWNNPKKHPLQEEHPESDRHLVEKSDVLRKFTHLENQIGVEFKHIRLLARAFTQSVHGLYDPKLTGGNYERLEFLGDAILKYVSSDYLYRHFPTHQEGHLTLLRSSLVNYRCLAQAARELGLNSYIIFQSYRESSHMKEKVCSDVFEALLGALHIEKGVDKGILYCQKLIEVCILSRLKEFIINQEWLDSKSQLQQCCHSLRDPANPLKDGNEYFQPIYKRLKYVAKGGVFYFKVGVYVNGRELGIGEGRSTKEAEKEAAKKALMNNYFEQYAAQKRIIVNKFGMAGPRQDDSDSDEGEASDAPKKRSSGGDDDDNDDGDADADDDDDDDDGDGDQGECDDDDDADDGDNDDDDADKEEVVNEGTALKGNKSNSSSAPTTPTSITKRKIHVKTESDELSSRNRRSDEASGRSSSRHRRYRRNTTTRTRDSSRRKSRSKSPPSRRRRSRERTERKRSRPRPSTSPTGHKRSKRRAESRKRKEPKEEPVDPNKPQMEISLDRWINEKNSTDDPSCQPMAPLTELNLETISSSENGDTILEPITSSENGDDMVPYEVISSSEFESDLDGAGATTAEIKEENEVEDLAEEMEKELRDMNSAEEANAKERCAEPDNLDDELDNIELEDIDLGDELNENHMGDDEGEGEDEVEVEEEKSPSESGSKHLSEDGGEDTADEEEVVEEVFEERSRESTESESEFTEVDVWEADDDDGDDDSSSASADEMNTTVNIETEPISPDDDISLDTGDISFEDLTENENENENENSHLELVSDDSLSEVEVY